jgi:hypothetical protein
MTYQNKTTFLEQEIHWLPIIETIFSSGLFLPFLVRKVVLLFKFYIVVFLEVLLLYEMKLSSLRIEQLTGPECFEACVHSRATTVQILFIKTWSSPTLIFVQHRIYSVWIRKTN